MTTVSFEALVELVEKLRGPDGCPWDKQQTYETLAPMTIEEAYELLEAIETGNVEQMKAELGDLIFQVVFYAKIAKERGEFTIEDVIAHVHEKMTRRHPHVFGDATARTSEDVLRRWEAIKLQEKAQRGGPEPPSILDGVSSRLPALIEATQLAERASRVGFDWGDAVSALEKLDEEVAEFKHAMETMPENRERLKEEIGDLLFMVANLARLLGLDAETALKAANRKFKERFRYIESELRRQGRSPEESTLEEMERLWQEAKRKDVSSSE
ncbi:MAG: nucleoside triphosphate pyrophosphohydrolase [Blastocatellia bacterium]|nr:nucleoside triphosphate pyrophosphohydrolase [Blastocatellia bacterium]MCS7156550.1 nucleoside triphosphate pyrophosphohydrolase [Blastocatellia bacterium]MDW8168810.1 nucleoside triphosphate pyrophosphohydrolase [Acidobacteriota bacterium]MDW8257476.1 nucleoside triphosphate pyrophosphohydrolase [Acidobacteriota bacterium]